METTEGAGSRARREGLGCSTNGARRRSIPQDRSPSLEYSDSRGIAARQSIWNVHVSSVPVMTSRHPRRAVDQGDRYEWTTRVAVRRPSPGSRTSG